MDYSSRGKKSRWNESIWMLTSLKFIHGTTADKDMWRKHSINQTWNNKKDSILSATVSLWSGVPVTLCQSEKNGSHSSILIRIFLHVYCVITDAISLLWFLYPYTRPMVELSRILWFYSSDFSISGFWMFHHNLLAHFWLQLKLSAAFVQFSMAPLEPFWSVRRVPCFAWLLVRGV